MMNEKVGIDLIRMSCPSCGASLKIGLSLDRFACGHCGNEYLVNRGGGIVSLEPVVEHLKHMQVGVNRTASELAIVRLKNEIREIDQKICVIQARPTPSVGWKGILVAAIIFLILFEFGLDTYNKTKDLKTTALYLGFAFVIFIGIIIKLRLVSKQIKVINYRIKSDAAPWHVLYQEKIKELEHHQQIVSLNH